MAGFFCTYCGKSFSRKEHLERHIPSHTNVKPYKCSASQLSFARRDLLQRHLSSYHESPEPMPANNLNIQRPGGRTPIACLNCATAKAGCDKNVPCTRCLEKNLPCAARFARRISKTATRTNRRMITPSYHTTCMDIDRNLAEKVLEHDHSCAPRNTPSDSLGGIQAAEVGYFPMDIISEQQLLGINEFANFSGNLDFSPDNFEDFLSWNDFPLALESFRSGEMSLEAVPQDISPRHSSVASQNTSTSHSKESMSTRASSLTSHTRHPSEGFRPTSASAKSATSRSVKIESSEGSRYDAAIVAEAAWPIARCNPVIFSDACPRTAILHLETLEQNSQNESVWDSLIDSPHLAKSSRGAVTVVPLSGSTRDRILAITQTFLHKALEIHRGGWYGWPKPSMQSSPGGGINFLVLPPSKTLEYFLQNYVHSLTSYYSLINGGTIDPNEMMLNNQASTLLVLLMIAQGATAIASIEARQLTAGLTETCRISLFDIIEKDVELSADPVVLRCALLFTMLAAWGGDKWHMDIAMGQRGMYLSMLKHGGMLEPQLPFVPKIDDAISKHLQWRSWVKRETKNRLCYNWVMLDQELSLFHDAACVFSTTELRAPIPSPESMWLAKDADEWLSAFEASDDRCRRRPSQSPTSKKCQSLCDLFQDLLHDNIRPDDQLSPLQLRLLLHPLHTLVLHLRDMLGCFSDGPSSYLGSRTVTKASTLSRLEEVQSLLQKWYGLCISQATSEFDSAATQENLVLYHLISLNAITSFPDIERVARREDEAATTSIPQLSRRCVYQGEQALFHCGQVFRLVNSMQKESRPHWWSAAIYRATMIVWIYGITRSSPQARPLDLGDVFTINTVTPEHPSVASYLWNSEGIPVLADENSNFTPLDCPGDVLEHCARFLDGGIADRMSEGIKRKLSDLSKNWQHQGLS